MMNIAVPLHQPTGERRSQDRQGLSRIGTLRIDDVLVEHVAIFDLSRDGCRIESALHLTADQAVEVGIAGIGRTAARIVWKGERSYGCEFTENLLPGAITAAFGPDNVARFPGCEEPDLAPYMPTGRVKFSARSRLAFIAAAAVTGWGVPLAALYLAVR